MRPHANSGLLRAVSRAVPAFAALLMVAGCSSAPPMKSATKPAAKQAARVDIQQDGTGFAITEDLRVGADVRADYDAALRLLEQKQYGPGIVLLLKVTQSAPHATATHIDLGIAYGRSGDLDRAVASLSTALDLSPKHPVALNELGMLYRRKGQFAAARASYEKALASFPEFHFARLNLAILCDLYLADSKCALEHYEAYRHAAPEDQQVVKWIADLRNRPGQ